MGKKENLVVLIGLFKMEFEKYTLDDAHKLATELRKLKVDELDKYYREMHSCKI